MLRQSRFSVDCKIGMVILPTHSQLGGWSFYRTKTLIGLLLDIQNSFILNLIFAQGIIEDCSEYLIGVSVLI